METHPSATGPNPGAYFAYAGYYRETTESTEGPAHATALRQNGVEALLVHHEDDPIVDAEETRKLDAFLAAHGVEHTTRVLAGESHEMTPEVLAEARAFVREACCGEEPSPVRGPATLAP